MTGRLSLMGLALSTTLLAGGAHAQEFRLNFGHYLGNSSFVKIEQDFVQRVE